LGYSTIPFGFKQKKPRRSPEPRSLAPAPSPFDAANIDIFDLPPVPNDPGTTTELYAVSFSASLGYAAQPLVAEEKKSIVVKKEEPTSQQWQNLENQYINPIVMLPSAGLPGSMLTFNAQQGFESIFPGNGRIWFGCAMAEEQHEECALEGRGERRVCLVPPLEKAYGINSRDDCHRIIFPAKVVVLYRWEAGDTFMGYFEYTGLNQEADFVSSCFA